MPLEYTNTKNFFLVISKFNALLRLEAQTRNNPSQGKIAGSSRPAWVPLVSSGPARLVLGLRLNKTKPRGKKNNNKTTLRPQPRLRLRPLYAPPPAMASVSRLRPGQGSSRTQVWLFGPTAQQHKGRKCERSWGGDVPGSEPPTSHPLADQGPGRKRER